MVSPSLLRLAWIRDYFATGSKILLDARTGITLTSTLPMAILVPYWETLDQCWETHDWNTPCSGTIDKPLLPHHIPLPADNALDGSKFQFGPQLHRRSRLLTSIAFYRTTQTLSRWTILMLEELTSKPPAWTQVIMNLLNKHHIRHLSLKMRSLKHNPMNGLTRTLSPLSPH